MPRSGFRRLGALLAAAGLLAAACDGGAGGDPTTQRPDRTPAGSPTLGSGYVVGLVGTMSGSEAWRGTDAFEGADLALSQVNRRRAEDEVPLELVTLDDGGEIGRATELVAELTASERTVAVLYAGPPAGLPPAHEALENAGVPAFLLYDDLYSARLLDTYLFQMSPPYLWQARRIARYLRRDRRYQLVGLVAETSLSGNTAQTSVSSALRSEGGIRLAARRYSDADDLDRVLDRMEERRVEALVVQGTPAVVAEVVSKLRERDSSYRSTSRARFASLPFRQRRQRRRSGEWRPQIIGFDNSISRRVGSVAAAGTVASDTYARGAHYLPVPSFESFHKAFMAWWNEEPIGWEQRAYEAIRVIDRALQRGRGLDQLLTALESLRGERYGGLPITFGPDDHTSVEQTNVGLWVVPRGGATVTERDKLPEDMPWVPLARGFSINGRRTDIPPEDWRYLFRNPPPRSAPAPPPSRMRFGVTTLRRDPVH